ncbi:MAG: hypothetical protein DRP58_02380 [Spirochaetes bacterium]|nr:MAG: hypothetical protein DRP58_02380 [Spirochaetota bacterium]
MKCISSKKKIENYFLVQRILFASEQCLNLMRKSLLPILRKNGLNHAQYLILMIVNYAEMNDNKIISTDLSYILGREKHTMTPQVDSLEKKDMLVRERSSSDRRAVFLRLTDRGRNLISRVQPQTMDVVSSVSVGTAENFKKIYNFLKNFRDTVADLAGQNPELYSKPYEKLLVAGEEKYMQVLTKRQNLNDKTLEENIIESQTKNEINEEKTSLEKT